MAKKKKKAGPLRGSTIALHRRARFDYEITERYDGGLVLRGTEVKSIRAGKVSLAEAYARVQGNELWLFGMHIAPYPPARENHDPTRARKVLLHRREIRRLAQTLGEQPRMTVIPVRLYLEHGLVKVELGLGAGRRHYDKRQVVRKREADRDMQRALRHAQR